jgi:hypothetical protein
MNTATLATLRTDARNAAQSRPHAFVPVFETAWTLGIAIEHVPGWAPTWAPNWEGLEQARHWARELNELNRLDAGTVARIIGTTLPPPPKQCGCASCRPREQGTLPPKPAAPKAPDAPQGPHGGSMVPRVPTPPQGGSPARIPQPVGIEW